MEEGTADIACVTLELLVVWVLILEFGILRNHIELWVECDGTVD